MLKYLEEEIINKLKLKSLNLNFSERELYIHNGFND